MEGEGERNKEKRPGRERERRGGVESQSSSHYLLTGIKTTIKPFDLPLAV